MNAKVCPCGSPEKIENCCLPYIKGTKTPQTAEALLRARYTAFTRGDIDFIVGSHHSKTRDGIKREEIEDWSKNSQWLGLQILSTELGTSGDKQGLITFVAKYSADGKVTEHRERALFEKEDGQWKFLDAQAPKTGPIVRAEPKVGRNDPCPCGSGKKAKKCCVK